MTPFLDEPDTPTTDSTAAAQRLQQTMATVRLSFMWLGVRKTLTPQQKAQAADSFGAEGKYLSAGKKLIDTSHPAYKAVTAIKGRAVSYWRGVTLPYPEPGLRLIRQDAINEFDNHMATFRNELDEAVAELQRHYDDLRTAARQRLGDLYNPADYPATLIGMFAIEHDFPSVEPPNYLQRLNPELYEQECRRMQSRFEEAVRLAEEAFLAEFSEVVSHLCERLSGDDDGKPKVFRNSAVTNLHEFFERFRSLNVGSSDDLDRLVEQAQQIVQGVRPQQLRENNGLRQQIATQLSGVQSHLDGLLVERPRRNILRPQRSAEE
jgi:hypothetical protein